jgi:heme A synthase
MADGLVLVGQLISVVLAVVGTLILVAAWRLGLRGKILYVFLLGIEFVWLGVFLSKLLPLLGVPIVWQLGLVAVLFVLLAVTLVLLYRHRHDPENQGGSQG